MDEGGMMTRGGWSDGRELVPALMVTSHLHLLDTLAKFDSGVLQMLICMHTIALQGCRSGMHTQ